MANLFFRGTTAGQIGATFAREGTLTGKRALRHMRRVAKAVMEQSIRNSPVDWKGPHGDVPARELEKSHKITEEYSGRRIESTVSVGGMVGNVDVDAYAEWIHNGSYNLGKASIAKRSVDPRNKVGPEFLQRAMDDETEDADFDPLIDELFESLLK